MLALAHKYLVFLPLALFCLAMHPDTANLTPPPGRMRSLPNRTLWVWERPENLRSIDPKTTAAATLDGTIVLGKRISVMPRRQFYSIPRGARRIAVIRIEAPGDIAPSSVPAVAQTILELASAPDIAALQIDFDARQSQRTFYRSLLRDLRRRMPPGLPLSMTALVSWCNNDNWIASLPVDEAVPMFFRMEPGRRFAQPDAPELRIREPLCAGAIGISTHEPAPASSPKARLYIFPDRGWGEDLPLVSSIDSVPRTQP